MVRIGFAYNQKPEPVDLGVTDAEEQSRPEDEPPSNRRDVWSRTSTAVAASTAAVLSESPSADDEFAEWDSAETIDAVERALSAVGRVIRLEATEEFPERLRAARPDIVFNIAEGLHGPNREAHVPAICEFYDIPYSGSDPFTLSLCLDKARTKEVLSHHGISTASFRVVRNERELEEVVAGSGEHGAAARSAAFAARRRRRFSSSAAAPTPRSSAPRFPVFVKPIHEGSSKGITERNYCGTPDELETQVAFLLERYRQPVMVEEFLPGAEFTCAVLGNGDGARVLPLVGMNFAALPKGALPVYGFEAKWVWDRPENPLDIFECPARIDEPLRRAIEETVLSAYHVLGCRDWSRIDVRLDAAGVPNVVEVNPLPGILPDPADNSCFPKAARAAGLSYDQLIQSCLAHAAERQNVPLSGKAARSRSRAAALG
jgi:D-alanine-D-alanine ligase